MNLGALTAILNVDTAGLLKAQAQMKLFAKQADATLARVSTTMKTVGTGMRTMGRGMSMYITAPMTLAGGAAMKMYKDFDFSMTKIIGLVGVSKNIVDDWRKDIIRMGPELGKAPKELADAMFFITSAGLRGAKALNALRVSAKASAAGLGETKVVADLVTSAMNAYGPAALNAKKATDILIATVREGKAPAEDLASSMGMVLPVASAMGVSFDQVGAAVAAMTRTGTGAQTASMQLRQILNSLLKPTQQAKEALGSMGISAAGLRKQIREKGLLSTLQTLKDLTTKYGETVMAKVFPNIRALSGVLDIMGKNLAQNRGIFERMTNTTGSLDKAFEAASQTVQFRLQKSFARLKTALTVLGKEVSTVLIPILTSLGDKVQKISIWFASLSEHSRLLIVKLGGIAAAAGPLLVILGVLSSSVIPGLISAIRVAQKAMVGLIGVMAANPYVVLGLAVGALVVHLLNHRKAAEKSATAQKKLNDEIQRGADLAGQANILQKQAHVMALMNKTQLEAFRSRVAQQVVIEKDYTIQIAAESRKRLDQDKKYQDLRTELEKATNDKQRILLKSLMYHRAQELLKGLGIEYTTQQQRIKLYQDTLDKIDALIKARKSAGVDQNIISPDTQKVLSDLNTQLKVNAETAKVMGSSYKVASENVNALLQAFQALIAQGEDLSSGPLQKVLEQLQAWKERATTITKETEELNKARDNMIQTDETVAQMEEAISKKLMGVHASTKAVNVAITATGVAAQFLGNVFSGMSNVIADAFNSTEGFLKSFEKFFIRFIKGLIAKLLAATIVALAFAAVLNLIFPGFEGVGSLGKAFKNITSFGKAFKTGMEMFGGYKMQEGGVVPPGYPNDTFPAKLSSGEAVIPLNRMSDMFSGKVEFRIGDDVMIGVLQRINSKKEAW